MNEQIVKKCGRFFRTVAFVNALALLSPSFLIAPLAEGEIGPRMTFVPTSVEMRPANAPLYIPQTLGIVTDAHHHSKETPVILITDAHANLSAQRNIAAILEHLSRRNRALNVLVEGAVGRVDTGILGHYPHIFSRNKVATELLKKLEINASDYFTITHPARNVNVQGLEDRRAYLQNLDAYRRVRENQDSFQKNLSLVSQKLEALEAYMYTPELKTFLRHYRAARDDRHSRWPAYIHYLIHEQRIVPVSAEAFPQLYVVMKEKSNASSVSSEKLLGEIERLEKNITRRLITGYNAAKLFMLTKNLNLLKRAASLTLTPGETSYMRLHRSEFAWTLYKSFLMRHQVDASSLEGWGGSLIEDILSFYHAASARDKTFLARLKMNRSTPDRLTVLITGGYHQPGLTEKLDRENIPYAVIVPRIHDETFSGLYRNQIDFLLRHTMAAASPFDLRPLMTPDAAAMFQANALLRMIAIHAASTREESTDLLNDYKEYYPGTVRAAEDREEMEQRAERTFAFAEQGFGATAPRKDEKWTFELSGIQNAFHDGVNNIIFVGGSHDDRSMHSVLSAISDNFKERGSIVRLIDAANPQEFTHLTRPFAANILFIIKNITHLANHPDKAKLFREVVTTEKNKFVISLVPADSFHQMKKALGGDASFRFVWRPLTRAPQISAYKKRSAAVIGASSFFGHSLYTRLRETRHSDRVVGTFNTGSQMSGEQKKEMRKLDVSNAADVERFLERHMPKDIYYLAAEVNLDRAQMQPEETLRLNAEYLRHFQPYLAAHPDARLIYISTDAVFPGNLRDGDAPYETYEPTQPPSRDGEVQVYGASKIEGERVVKEIAPNNHVIIRLPFLIGANIDNPNRENRLLEKIVATLDARVRNGPEPLRLDNIRVRQPLLIDEAAISIERLIMNDVQGTYHLAGPETLTEYQLALRVTEIYRRLFPFLTFETPSEKLLTAFVPVVTEKSAPRASRALLAPSDTPTPLDTALRKIILSLSKGERGSGRSIVQRRDDGTILKRSTNDERGKEKLRDEIKWLLYAREVPELRPHIPELINYTDTKERVELIMKAYPAASLAERVLRGDFTLSELESILTEVYTFVAKHIHTIKADGIPDEIRHNQHFERANDRLDEFSERAQKSSARNADLIERLLRFKYIKVNDVRYLSIADQLQRLIVETASDTVVPGEIPFRIIITPPPSAISRTHGDLHMANILFDQNQPGRFILIDPKGHTASDYLYDAAKVIHDFIGLFHLFNYGQFETSILSTTENNEIEITYLFNKNKFRKTAEKLVSSGALSRILLSTLISKEKRDTDPYWFIRLAFTHAFHWAAIPPFQIRGDDASTAITIYGHSLTLFQEFFDLYNAWKDGDLKKFLAKHNGRYLGFSYDDLEGAGFQVDGPRGAGFGFVGEVPEKVYAPEQFDNALQSVQALQSDWEISREHARAVLDADTEKVSRALRESISGNAPPHLTLTDQDHLPRHPASIRKSLEQGGELAFTFLGSKEEGEAFFQKRFGFEKPAGVHIIPFTRASQTSGEINRFIQDRLSAGRALEHTVAYFGGESRALLRKIPRRISRVAALPGGQELLEWEVLQLLAIAGQNHPALAPFLHALEDGVFQIASLEEYLYKAIQAKESISKAA